MAYFPKDYNEDDFEEYNPHPYRGGYDIALTYGPPLPPSSAICYPISTTTAVPSPSPASPVIPSNHLSTTEPERRRSPPPPTATTYDYGLPENHRPEPFPWPDLFRNWPDSNPAEREIYGGGGGTRDYAEGNGFWNWRRGLDYLFGHADGYGERMIGVDSYGIPIYFSKKHAGEPILVEVEPASVQRLDFYEDSRSERLDSANYGSWSSGFYDEKRDEIHHGFGDAVVAYNRHYSEKALTVEMNPHESMWYERTDYHEVYPTEQVHYNELSASYNEGNSKTTFSESSHYAYDQRYQEQTLHRQVMPNELSWSQMFSYQNGCQEPSVSYHKASYCNKQNDENSFFGGSSCEYERHSYQLHDYQLHDHVHFQPFRPTLFEDLGHNTAYEDKVPPMSIKKENYRAYEGPQSSIFDWQSSEVADQGDKGTIFGNPNYVYQGQQYDKPAGDQLEPYKPTWSQYASYYEDHNEPSTECLFQPSSEVFQLQ